MAQILTADSSPNQSFQSVLTVDGQNINLQFFIRWNDIAGYWTMSITDVETSTLLLDSIPLVTSDYPGFNILSQYVYFKIGSCYLFNIGGVSANPSQFDLGSNFIIVWGDTL